MTPQKINIAIAEACRWTPHLKDHRKHRFWRHPTTKIIYHHSELPNYAGSLDAMHEAILTLPVPNKFCAILFTVCVPQNLEINNAENAHINATAAQRAEAFLKCLGKWIE